MNGSRRRQALRAAAQDCTTGGAYAQPDERTERQLGSRRAHLHRWLGPALFGLLFVYALLQAAVVLQAESLSPSLEASREKREVLHDYLAHHMAGEMVSEGHADRVYDVAAQEDYRLETLPGISPAGRPTFINPPHVAWLQSLLVPLGYEGSLITWRLLSIVCLGLTALLWCRWLGIHRALGALALTALLASSAHAVLLGQDTFVSLLILTTFCALLLDGHEGWSGLILSLQAFKYQFMALPAIMLLLKRRWRFVFGLVVGGTLTVGLIAATLGAEILLEYVRFGRELGSLMTTEGFLVAGQYSWFGFFQLVGQDLLPTVAIRGLALSMSAVTLALLVPVWRGRWEVAPERAALQLSALLAAALLTSPHFFYYDMSLMALPVVLWWYAGLESGTRLPYARVAKLLVGLGFSWLWIAVTFSAAARIGFEFTPWILFGWVAMIAAIARGWKPVDSPTGSD